MAKFQRQILASAIFGHVSRLHTHPLDRFRANFGILEAHGATSEEESEQVGRAGTPTHLTGFSAINNTQQASLFCTHAHPLDRFLSNKHSASELISCLLDFLE